MSLHSHWLAAEDRTEWIPNLLRGIAEVVHLLRRFPEVGVEIAEDEGLVLRRLRLRRYPYVVWYAYERRRRIADVWLVRLFAAHQDRPDPDPTAWDAARIVRPRRGGSTSRSGGRARHSGQ